MSSAFPPLFDVSFKIHAHSMFTEMYIEALLVDKELADQVWDVWCAGEIDDVLAYLAWMILACSR